MVIHPYRTQPTTATAKTSVSTIVGVLGPLPNLQKNMNSTSNVRQISNQEARERQEKGLCYYCDEKFIPGHRCQRPQLFMISDTNDQDSEEQSEVLQAAEDQEAIPEISLHVIAGTAHPQTFRVIGRLRSKEVMVLIDGGSTHNFIDQSMVNKYELPMVPNRKFQVTVANREKIDCIGLYPSLTIMIQGQIVTADYFILLVAACLVVLGVQWLATLGPVETDYKRLTMSFKKDGNLCVFQGLKQSGLQVSTEKEFNTMYISSQFFAIIPVGSITQPNSHPSEIAQLLSNFSHVFNPPTSLPPKRSHDHQITLQPNAQPVSVRPYRYPYYQKTEIERMVK
jgi:hypothetical protein